MHHSSLIRGLLSCSVNYSCKEHTFGTNPEVLCLQCCVTFLLLYVRRWCTSGNFLDGDPEVNSAKSKAPGLEQTSVLPAILAFGSVCSSVKCLRNGQNDFNLQIYP